MEDRIRIVGVLDLKNKLRLKDDKVSKSRRGSPPLPPTGGDPLRDEDYRLFG